jgi:hypothetical protein
MTSNYFLAKIQLAEGVSIVKIKQLKIVKKKNHGSPAIKYNNSFISNNEETSLVLLAHQYRLLHEKLMMDRLAEGMNNLYFEKSSAGFGL